MGNILEIKPKFSIGDAVYYVPKLSGFNNKTVLVIRNVTRMDDDGLAAVFGVNFNPTFLYHFDNISLCAIESDLSSFTKRGK
jgi:hypothetical protein